MFFAQSIFVLLLLSPVVDVSAGGIKIKAIVDGTNSAEGIYVSCWDEDSLKNDDFMGDAYLDQNGEAVISYSNPSVCWGYWDCFFWRNSSNPDIYCKLALPGDCVRPEKIETKNNENPSKTTDFGTVNLVSDESYCNPDYSWNGCGAGSFPAWLREISNQVSGFEDSCNEHDVCYQVCGEKRSVCDALFKVDMYDQCGGNFACGFLAELYYNLALVGGETPCRTGRTSCTPDEQDLCTK